MNIRRVIITEPPFPDFAPGEEQKPWYAARRYWPFDWVAPDQPVETPVVVLYRRQWEQPAAQTVRLHATADERYELWLDGERIGEGPERCSRDRWAYEKYEIELPPGVPGVCRWRGKEIPLAGAVTIAEESR